MVCWQYPVDLDFESTDCGVQLEWEDEGLRISVITENDIVDYHVPHEHVSYLLTWMEKAMIEAKQEMPLPAMTVKALSTQISSLTTYALYSMSCRKTNKAARNRLYDWWSSIWEGQGITPSPALLMWDKDYDIREISDAELAAMGLMRIK